ncbi:MAG: acyl-CoA desaturase [Bacteroidetes bacterium]|nr:acyl-CoA desaturase [Bacteroidota bacterium]
MVPRFSPERPVFQLELKKRVEAYFKEKDIRMTGNWKLYVKSGVLTLSFIVLYSLLVFFTPHWTLALLLCVIFGVNVAAIGFNVMHDGAHGSFSTSRVWNNLAANSLDFLGASSFMWRVKHNLIHHTYTNIDGLDDDIDVKPWMRMTLTQKKYFFHRFQHIYFILLYSFLYLLWIGVMDFQKYFKGKVGEIAIKEMAAKDHIIFWASKLSFIAIFIVLPIYMTGIVSYLIGFFVFSATTGIIISLVFQLAHAVEDVEFPSAAEGKNVMEDEWAVHQVKTTANFATKNKIVTWLVGGLNFQIEHHLFPKISHIHYPEISKIVKKTSEEFGIKYQEYTKTRHAIVAHFLLLKKVGAAA